MTRPQNIERKSASAAERRSSSREAVCQGATVLRQDGSVAARGRTSNLSPRGVFVISRLHGQLPEVGDPVLVELTLSAAAVAGGKGRRTRIVKQDGRIVRTTRLGQLVGLGIEFTRT